MRSQYQILTLVETRAVFGLILDGSIGRCKKLLEEAHIATIAAVHGLIDANGLVQVILLQGRISRARWDRNRAIVDFATELGLLGA